MSYRSLFLSFLLVSSSFGAAQVATITSDEPFQLGGVSVPVASATAWPLVSGDVISTYKSHAVILYPDGSRVTVDKNTQIKLDSDDKNGNKLHLLGGSIWYSLSSGSKLAMYGANEPVKPSATGSWS